MAGSPAWGQSGPLAQAVGHDIDYIALAGALGAIGRAGHKPTPPLNLVGDFGGGGMPLAFGVMCALFERQRSGRGQVVDAAMVDGAASLMTMFAGLAAEGSWTDERGANVLDSGAPYYEVYETEDGGYMAVGAIEKRFYDALLAALGLDRATLPDRNDKANWPELKRRFAKVFKTRTRDAWEKAFAGGDACAAPVLSLAEAARHPHALARAAWIERDGVVQPAPMPRFDRTPGAVAGPPPRPGEHTRAALADWGVAPAEIDRLLKSGAIVEGNVP